MKTTIDRTGRLVIPLAMRARVGLEFGGDVELEVDGAGLRIEPIAGAGLVEEAGILVIPASGNTVTDAMVNELRHAEQR